MNNQITFILPTRNDEYSCSMQNKEEEQAKKVLLPILSSKKYFPNSKFIIIEYCPLKDKKPLKEILQGKIENVEIVTLKQELSFDLDIDFSIKKMNFYEHVSKHIGVLLAETDYVCVLNQDVVLTKFNTEELLSELKQNKVCLAKKCKVTYECMNLEVEQIIEKINNRDFPYTEVGLWGNGDFLMLSKDLYNKMGGLLMAHQNWAIDNEILLRAGLRNMENIQSVSEIQFSRPYEIVCPDHITDGLGRPFIGDVSDPFAMNAVLISPSIVEKINNLYYVEKREKF